MQLQPNYEVKSFGNLIMSEGLTLHTFKIQLYQVKTNALFIKEKPLNKKDKKTIV